MTKDEWNMLVEEHCSPGLQELLLLDLDEEEDEEK
jgi:hypothetical protein